MPISPARRMTERKQFARLPINITRMLLHSPRVARGFLDLAIGFRQGVLDPKLREMTPSRGATSPNSSPRLEVACRADPDAAFGLRSLHKP
jgi:hypothetical protein